MWVENQLADIRNKAKKPEQAEARITSFMKNLFEGEKLLKDAGYATPKPTK